MLELLFIAGLALTQCEHMAHALAYYHIPAEAGDRHAQETLALYVMACEATMESEVGDITRWDCVVNLQPGAAHICEFEVEL